MLILNAACFKVMESLFVAKGVLHQNVCTWLIITRGRSVVQEHIMAQLVALKVHLDNACKAVGARR